MRTKNSLIQLRHPHEARPVKIVADAAISTSGLHGGRLLPVVLLDTTDRPDVATLIRVHQSFGFGDVKTQWGQIEGHEGTVALFLTFVRPVELFMVLEFDIARQGVLVEQALVGQGIYLTLAESADDRLIKNIDRPKVIIEISDTGFRKMWDALFERHLVKDFRKNGLSRSDSRRAARSAIDALRKWGALRLRQSYE